MKKYILFLILALAATAPLPAQTEEFLPFGRLDQWITREIHESGIIGGATKLVYAIGPTDTIRENKAYRNTGGSPWGSSNVMARVAGITKTNTSVFPEEHDGGWCARMDTRMESVKVLGLVNITVLAAGSIYLGEMQEPVRDTKDPQRKINSGISFTRRPTALRFDYRIRMSDRPCRLRATGFSRIVDVDGIDYAEANLFLQHRWEDDDGHIYARRVGTMVVRYEQTTDDWQVDATYPILYGDITGHPDYRPEMMRLMVEERFAINSRGERVPIQEVGWAEAGEEPTHLFIQFTSSHGGAYIGSPGNTFWVDNVRLVY